MLNIIQNGRLGKIIFLGPFTIPPHEFPDVGMPISNTHFLKNLPFKMIKAFGGLRLYDLGLNIIKMEITRVPYFHWKKQLNSNRNIAILTSL